MERAGESQGESRSGTPHTAWAAGGCGSGRLWRAVLGPDVRLLPRGDGLPLRPEGPGGPHVHWHPPGLLSGGCLCVGLTVGTAFWVPGQAPCQPSF